MTPDQTRRGHACRPPSLSNLQSGTSQVLHLHQMGLERLIEAFMGPAAADSAATRTSKLKSPPLAVDLTVFPPQSPAYLAAPDHGMHEDEPADQSHGSWVSSRLQEPACCSSRQ